MNTYIKQIVSFIIMIAIWGNSTAEPEKRAKKPDSQQQKKEPEIPTKSPTDTDNDSPAFLAATVFNANSPSLLTSLVNNKALLTGMVNFYKQQDPSLKPARIIKVFNHIPLESRVEIIQSLQTKSYSGLPPFNTLESLAPAKIVDAPCQVQNPQTPTSDQAIETLVDYAIKYVAIAAAQENTTKPNEINVTANEFATDAIQYLSFMKCSERVVGDLKSVIPTLIKEAKDLEDVRIAAIEAGKISLKSSAPAFPDPQAIRNKLKVRITQDSIAEDLLTLYAEALAQSKEKGANQSVPNLISNNPFLDAALAKYKQTSSNNDPRKITRARGYLIAGVLSSVGTALNTFLSARPA